MAMISIMNGSLTPISPMHNMLTPQEPTPLQPHLVNEIPSGGEFGNDPNSISGTTRRKWRQNTSQTFAQPHSPVSHCERKDSRFAPTSLSSAGQTTSQGRHRGLETEKKRSLPPCGRLPGLAEYASRVATSLCFISSICHAARVAVQRAPAPLLLRLLVLERPAAAGWPTLGLRCPTGSSHTWLCIGRFRHAKASGHVAFREGICARYGGLFPRTTRWLALLGRYIGPLSSCRGGSATILRRLGRRSAAQIGARVFRTLPLCVGRASFFCLCPLVSHSRHCKVLLQPAPAHPPGPARRPRTPAIA
jgi:hypothetical protein